MPRGMPVCVMLIAASIGALPLIMELPPAFAAFLACCKEEYPSLIV
jgi:hypothetical protein